MHYMLRKSHTLNWSGYDEYTMNEYTVNILTQFCYELVLSRAGADGRTRAGCSRCHHTPDHVVQTLLYLIG